MKCSLTYTIQSQVAIIHMYIRRLYHKILMHELSLGRQEKSHSHSHFDEIEIRWRV